MEIESDYDVLMRRVASGELGSGNLVSMILDERAHAAALRLEVRHWQVLRNELAVQLHAIDEAEVPDFLSLSDLVELILWLALPWGDNDPLFPESDGWTPVALEANRRMARTWQRVVRPRNLATSTGAVPRGDVVEKGDGDAIESIGS